MVFMEVREYWNTHSTVPIHGVSALREFFKSLYHFFRISSLATYPLCPYSAERIECTPVYESCIEITVMMPIIFIALLNIMTYLLIRKIIDCICVTLIRLRLNDWICESLYYEKCSILRCFIIGKIFAIPSILQNRHRIIRSYTNKLYKYKSCKKIFILVILVSFAVLLRIY